MFEIELRNHLINHAGLNALINGRVYPGRLPDPPTLPALVYTRVSTVSVSAYDGPLAEVEARFQIDAWGERQSDVRQVAEQIRLALLGFNGDMGGIGTQIPRQTNDLDSYETETGLYRVITEFLIWHGVTTA